MKKYVIILTEEDKEKLNEIRLKSLVLKERQKAGAIYLNNEGYEISKIAKVVGISRLSVIAHAKLYLQKGMDYISENNYTGNNISELEEYADIIKKELEENPVRTIDEARIRIEELTGIKRGNTQIRKFLVKKNLHTKSQEQYQQRQMGRNKKNF